MRHLHLYPVRALTDIRGRIPDVKADRVRQHRSEQRSLRCVDLHRTFAKESLCCRAHAVDSLAKLRDVQIDLQNSPLRPEDLQKHSEVRLKGLPDIAPALPEEQVSRDLLRDGTRSTEPTLRAVLLDGRSIYLDFFGFVMWDFLPVNFNEIKQIEVIRGPASAVWGANALYGVVNVITKSPRELQGTSVSVGLGTFDREVNGDGADAGSLVYFSGTHAQALLPRAP